MKNIHNEIDLQREQEELWNQIRNLTNGPPNVDENIREIGDELDIEREEALYIHKQDFYKTIQEAQNILNKIFDNDPNEENI